MPKLKDFAKIYSGATPSTNHPEFYDGEIVWFTPKDLSDPKTKYIATSERTITQSGYNSCSTSLLPSGTLLLSTRAPIGLLSIAKKECCTNQGFKSIVVDESKCYNEFLYYYLKYHMKEIDALGSGTTFKEVSKNAIENYNVELPPLSLQKSIASVLSDLDSKIENNNKICAELENMAKTLYDYWFVQFDFPDENGKPYKTSGGKMTYNEQLKREIPAGWEVKKLGEICTLKNGVNYDKNSEGDTEYKIVNVRNITESTMLLNPANFDTVVLDKALGDKYLTKDTDILIARSGSPGAVRLLQNCKDTIFCGFIIACTPVKGFRNYLMFTLKRLEGTKATQTGGSILQNVSQETLKNIHIALPSNEILEKYNNFVAILVHTVQNNVDEMIALASLRDFLLPMLMNGQVTIE